MAAPLDQDGKLAEALHLYRAQAETTLSKADRLHYAGALMRAGRAAEAQAIYEQVSADASSPDSGTRAAVGAAICASSLLASGFPARAVPYARQAHALDTDDPSLLLLLVRALAASGDATAARSALRPVVRVPSAWTIGQRIELARWRWLTGDAVAARRILDAKPPEESVAQMFRDSILANAPLEKGDWQAAADLLDKGMRKAPTGLGDQRVARQWRNAQRELWSMQLRRAISLLQSGQRELAAADAAKAQRSDEEYVRSAACLLLVAVDLRNGQQDSARARLQALAGHDVRFADSSDVLAANDDPNATAHHLQVTLGQLDRSADFVTRPLSELVADAARPSGAAAGVGGSGSFTTEFTEATEAVKWGAPLVLRSSVILCELCGESHSGTTGRPTQARAR
jgi:tetratricopeptide (TPR) repeat protein